MDAQGTKDRSLINIGIRDPRVSELAVNSYNLGKRMKTVGWWGDLNNSFPSQMGTDRLKHLSKMSQVIGLKLNS